MTWDYLREDKQSVKLRLALQEGQLLFSLEDILEGVCDAELPHCRIAAFAKNLLQVGNRGYFHLVGGESERGAIRRPGVRKRGDFRHLRGFAEIGLPKVSARKRGFFRPFSSQRTRKNVTRSLGVFLQTVTRGMTQAFGRERILFQATKDPGILQQTPNIDSILRVGMIPRIPEKGVEILPHVNGPFGTTVREGPSEQYPKFPPTFPSFTSHPLAYGQDAVYLPQRPSDELLSQEHRPMGSDEILTSSLPKRVCLESEVPAGHGESQAMLGEMEGTEGMLPEMEGTADVNGSLGLLLNAQPTMEFPIAHRGNREETAETTHFEPTMYESMLNGGNQVNEEYMDENAGILNTMTHGEEEIRSREREEPLSEEVEGNSDTAVWVGKVGGSFI